MTKMTYTLTSTTTDRYGAHFVMTETYKKVWDAVHRVRELRDELVNAHCFKCVHDEDTYTVCIRRHADQKVVVEVTKQ